MKHFVSILLFCVLQIAATAQQPQLTAVALTKGRLSFDSKAVTFQTKDKAHRYAFPDPKISSQAAFPQIPGLRIESFDHRSRVSAKSGLEVDASRLKFLTEDGVSFTLVAGRPIEVYRIEITFADHGQLTLWQLASNLK